MKFTKLQGAGNDFVLIEAPHDNKDWNSLSQRICDRHYGIGADGLILLLSSTKADIRMRIFNPDGSEAEACGNGTRCLAKYVIENGINSNPDLLLIETLSGVRQVRLHSQEGSSKTIQVAMGKPHFTPGELPVNIKSDDARLKIIKEMLSYRAKIDDRELLLNLVSMGNPHAIYFSDEPAASFPLTRYGPKVEKFDIFPKRTNFEVATVINRKRIDAVVWERGAGLTLACGTGACATVVAAQILGYVDKIVDINLPGGRLNVEWEPESEVFLSGPAEIVFTGELKD